LGVTSQLWKVGFAQRSYPGSTRARGEPDEALPGEMDRDIEAIAPAAEQAFDVADA
jgi:hypothetical protein